MVGQAAREVVLGPGDDAHVPGQSQLLHVLPPTTATNNQYPGFVHLPLPGHTISVPAGQALHSLFLGFI